MSGYSFATEGALLLDELARRNAERTGYTGPVSRTLPPDWKPATTHRDHQKLRDLNVLIATCEDCGLSRLRRWAQASELTHKGRAGRRIQQVRLESGLPM